MQIEQGDLLGTAFVGVFGATNDKVTFLPHNAEDEFVELAESVLNTEAVRLSVASSPLIGVLTAMNSGCIALPHTAYREERELIESYLDTVEVRDFTAVGNLVAANDNGIALSPLLAPQQKALSGAFGVKCSKAKAAGLETVGSCVVVTNKGFLANPNTTKEEMSALEKVLGVSGEVGSLNYGNPFVRGCILANSSGAIVGSTSTPFELGRVDDALFFKR